MHIAVLGAGSIGRTLGSAWQRAGHSVLFGTRDPARYPDLQGATTMPVALAEPDAILLAVPGGAVPDVLAEHGGALAGRLVLDATNRVGGAAFHQLPLVTAAAGPRVFRAFSTVGFEVFAEPRFGGEAADLFFCGPPGDDAGTVEGLIADVGLRPVRLGDLDRVELLDGLTRLWFSLAIGDGRGRHLAFRLLADDDASPSPNNA